MFINDALSNATMVRGKVRDELYYLEGQVRSFDDNSTINTHDFSMCKKGHTISIFLQ